MKYFDLTHKEKVHIEEIYGELAFILKNNYRELNKNANSVFVDENGNLLICKFIVSIAKNDIILNKLSFSLRESKVPGFCIIKFDDELNQSYFQSDILRYLIE